MMFLGEMREIIFAKEKNYVVRTTFIQNKFIRLSSKMTMGIGKSLWEDGMLAGCIHVRNII